MFCATIKSKWEGNDAWRKYDASSFCQHLVANQCDVPAVVGEEEMLLKSSQSKKACLIQVTASCPLFFLFFFSFLVDCKDCIILVKNVFDRLLHSKSLLDPSDCNLSSFFFFF